MARNELTPEDWRWLAECYRDSVAECADEGWTYEGEAVMTSIGYVEIQPGGDVVGFGTNFGNAPEICEFCDLSA